MTFLKRCSALLMAALLMSVLGCASTSNRSSTGEYVDDAMITAKVKTMLFDQPSLKVLQINVETFKNVVQLSGFVDSTADMNLAMDVARKVNGVQSVHNDMRLR